MRPVRCHLTVGSSSICKMSAYGARPRERKGGQRDPKAPSPLITAPARSIRASAVRCQRSWRSRPRLSLGSVAFNRRHEQCWRSFLPERFTGDVGRCRPIDTLEVNLVNRAPRFVGARVRVCPKPGTGQEIP